MHGQGAGNGWNLFNVSAHKVPEVIGGNDIVSRVRISFHEDFRLFAFIFTIPFKFKCLQYPVFFFNKVYFFLVVRTPKIKLRLRVR